MLGKSRQKASDIFQETSFFIAKKSGFDQAFPQIASLSGTVEDNRDDISDWRRVRQISQDTGEYFDCSNPPCYKGGFSVGDILRGIVASGAKHKEDNPILPRVGRFAQRSKTISRLHEQFSPLPSTSSIATPTRSLLPPKHSFRSTLTR